MLYDERHRLIASTRWLQPRGQVNANAVEIAGDAGVPAAEGLTSRMVYFDEVFIPGGLFPYPELTTTLQKAFDDGISLEEGFSSGSALISINPAGEPVVSIKDGIGRSLVSAALNSSDFANGTYTPVTWGTSDYDTVTAGGLLETIATDALDHINRSRTDGAGRMIEAVDAENQLSTFLYDNNSSLLQSRDANQVGLDCVFDERNRRTSCTDTQGDTTSQVYDQNNNTVTQTDAKGASVPLAYTMYGTAELPSLTVSTAPLSQSSTPTAMC